MSDSVEYRAALEFRAESDPDRMSAGILHGTLLEYERRASDRPEAFAKGALTWPSDGVVLNESHRRNEPVARVVPTVVGDRVEVRAAIPDTQRGRDLIRMVKDRVLNGLSVEFRAAKETTKDGLRWIEKAALHGIGVVAQPAYQEAVVEARKRRRRYWL